MRVRVLLFHFFVCESLCVCTLNMKVFVTIILFLAVAYLGSTILWCFSLFFTMCVCALDLFLCTVNSI